MVSAPTVGYDRLDGRGSFWGLAGSASLKEKTLAVTVVNPHASEARGTEVVVRGAGVRSGRALTLTARELNAHNSFDQPRALEPKEAAVTIGAGGVVSHAFAPASVTRLTLELA